MISRQCCLPLTLPSLSSLLDFLLQQGPTLTLKVAEYSLIRDVIASQARPRIPQNAFKTAPLVVLNNFGNEEHMRLATVREGGGG